MDSIQIEVPIIPRLQRIETEEDKAADNIAQTTNVENMSSTYAKILYFQSLNKSSGQSTETTSSEGKAQGNQRRRLTMPFVYR